MLFAESTHLYAIECLLVMTRHREPSTIPPAITRSYILQNHKPNDGRLPMNRNRRQRSINNDSRDIGGLLLLP